MEFLLFFPLEVMCNVLDLVHVPYRTEGSWLNSSLCMCVSLRYDVGSGHFTRRDLFMEASLISG